MRLCFSYTHKRRLPDKSEQAGADLARIIHEPTAAADTTRSTVPFMPINDQVTLLRISAETLKAHPQCVNMNG
jgi:hypothetical protein